MRKSSIANVPLSSEYASDKDLQTRDPLQEVILNQVKLYCIHLLYPLDLLSNKLGFQFLWMFEMLEAQNKQKKK